jgi:hypothetical protein
MYILYNVSVRLNILFSSMRYHSFMATTFSTLSSSFLRYTVHYTIVSHSYSTVQHHSSFLFLSDGHLVPVDQPFPILSSPYPVQHHSTLTFSEIDSSDSTSECDLSVPGLFHLTQWSLDPRALFNDCAVLRCTYAPPGCYPFIIHGRWSWFHILAMVESAVINTEVQMSLP